MAGRIPPEEEAPQPIVVGELNGRPMLGCPYETDDAEAFTWHIRNLMRDRYLAENEKRLAAIKRGETSRCPYRTVKRRDLERHYEVAMMTEAEMAENGIKEPTRRLAEPANRAQNFRTYDRSRNAAAAAALMDEGQQSRVTAQRRALAQQRANREEREEKERAEREDATRERIAKARLARVSGPTAAAETDEGPAEEKKASGIVLRKTGAPAATLAPRSDPPAAQGTIHAPAVPFEKLAESAKRAVAAAKDAGPSSEINVLAPIIIDLDIDGRQLKEQFLWNVAEETITPEAFASITCMDLDLPSAFYAELVNSIRDQLDHFRTFRPVLPDPSEPRLFTVNLDIHLGDVYLRDSFLWDISNPNNKPEQFVDGLVADLGLSSEFRGPIATQLREEIVRITQEAAAGEVLAVNDRIGLRDDPDLDKWMPKVGQLQPEDIDRMNTRMQRVLRYKRRHVESARNATGTRGGGGPPTYGIARKRERPQPIPLPPGVKRKRGRPRIHPRKEDLENMARWKEQGLM